MAGFTAVENPFTRDGFVGLADATRNLDAEFGKCETMMRDIAGNEEKYPNGKDDIDNCDKG